MKKKLKKILKLKTKTDILKASVILAAIIVASTSFAWFSSSDEVINRLSANANYGVSILEDFSPPTKWYPGQTTVKRVYATNTGSIDSFAKASISGNINLTHYVAPDTAFDSRFASKYVQLVYDPSHPNIDEVAQLQSNGKLVVRPKSADDALLLTRDKITADSVGQYDTKGFSPGADNSNLQGLYVFERSAVSSEDNEYKYYGYYYVPDEEGTGGIYYSVNLSADETDTTITAVLPKTDTNTITEDKFTYDISHNDKIIATYYGADNDPDTKNDNIIINMYYDPNSVTTAEDDKTWFLTMEINPDSDVVSYIPVFYCNKLIHSGETVSGTIITAVELDENVSGDALISMKYNLDVQLNSAQIVEDRSDSDKAVSAVNTMYWAIRKAHFINGSERVQWH